MASGRATTSPVTTTVDRVNKPAAKIDKASPHETLDAILATTRRTDTPLRAEFLQRRTKKANKPRPGPLARLVERHDHHGLRLYLLLVTKASSEPYDAALAAPVWARALGFDDPTGRSATTRISRIWGRLEEAKLIERGRRRRMAHLTLLCEDGSGKPYTLPAAAKDPYFKVPTSLWTATDADGDRWHEVLTLPELAMLLIARSLSDGFRLPLRDVPSWYGISDDTALRGLTGLADHGILDVAKLGKKAPLAPEGYTVENRYTLQPPFGPKGRPRQGADAS